jgi:LAO/AO transport system ATPase
LPAGLLQGERRAVARAISRLEQGAADAATLRVALAPHLGRAHVIGITGAPGAGKSTLVHALLGAPLARGRRIGVVAVDPSSPLTFGALLGDRVRMGKHGAHPGVFIRSVASRGHLGGLSPTTCAIVDVFDAAGFDTVIVETVGAGQSEVEIMRVADTRVVACPPGLGDDVQAIKAGILEIADLLVVTKADLPGAAATARDLREMLHLRVPAPGAWKVPVLSVSATHGEGVAALLDQAEAHATAVGCGRRLHAGRPACSRRRSACSASPPPTRTSRRPGCAARKPARARPRCAWRSAPTTSTSSAVATEGSSSRSPTPPSGWPPTRTARWPPVSTPTSPTSRARRPATRSSRVRARCRAHDAWPSIGSMWSAPRTGGRSRASPAPST